MRSNTDTLSVCSVTPKTRKLVQDEEKKQRKRLKDRQKMFFSVLCLVAALKSERFAVVVSILEQDHCGHLPELSKFVRLPS